MSKDSETVDLFPELKPTDVVEIRFLLKLAKPANVVSELAPRVERLLKAYEGSLSELDRLNAKLLGEVETSPPSGKRAR